MARETAAQREARMQRALAGRNGADGAVPPRTRSVRMKPVRMTLDLSPALHRNLKGWTVFAARELDVADVPAAEVLRILVEVLTTPPDQEELARPLVMRVLGELRERQQ